MNLRLGVGGFQPADVVKKGQPSKCFTTKDTKESTGRERTATKFFELSEDFYGVVEDRFSTGEALRHQGSFVSFPERFCLA